MPPTSLHRGSASPLSHSEKKGGFPKPKSQAKQLHPKRQTQGRPQTRHARSGRPSSPSPFPPPGSAGDLTQLCALAPRPQGPGPHSRPSRLPRRSSQDPTPGRAGCLPASEARREARSAAAVSNWRREPAKLRAQAGRGREREAAALAGGGLCGDQLPRRPAHAPWLWAGVRLYLKGCRTPEQGGE